MSLTKHPIINCYCDEMLVPVGSFPISAASLWCPSKKDCVTELLVVVGLPQNGTVLLFCMTYVVMNIFMNRECLECSASRM